MQAPIAKTARMVEPQKEKRLPAAKRRQLEARQDVDDFAAEYRMLKKVKKGKMSEVRTAAAQTPPQGYKQPSVTCTVQCAGWLREPRICVSAA